MTLRAVAEVNLAAIERNAARLCERIGGAKLCAVVKADAYGHGAVRAARAALTGGASMLAVVTAEEAAELRRARFDVPLLVLGALSAQELPVALAAGVELTAWDMGFVQELCESVRHGAAPGPVAVHVKLDSGLGRLGTRDPERALAIARAVQAAPELRLAGAMTHFATADDDQEFVARQLEAFTPFAARVRELAPDVVVHAANSPGALLTPASHFDMVRAGIALYGGDPMNHDPADHGLEPALALRSYVAAVKPIAPGESVGYGRHWIATTPTMIATLPIGYGDGLSRRLADNLEVLIGGRRYPLRGMVSMDNITVEVGSDAAVAVGQVATIIGRDGAEHQTAEQVAQRLGTISYEVFCMISKRVPRTYHRDGEPV